MPSSVRRKRALERETGLEPATICLEGRHSTRLSYSRMGLRRKLYGLAGGQSIRAGTRRRDASVGDESRCRVAPVGRDGALARVTRPNATGQAIRLQND
jgi:hypothetical protein